jgi:hypothetical protein
MNEHTRISANELSGAIERSVEEVLETMFFTGIEACLADGFTPLQDSLAAELRFDGALQGDFQLLVDRSAVEGLGDTLLCPEPAELGPEQTGQVACELANIICGCALSHLEPEADLTLGTPRAVADPQPLAGGVHRSFQLPEGFIRIGLRLDEEPRLAFA